MISDVDKNKNTSHVDKDKNTSNVPSFSGNELDAWFGLSDSTPNIEVHHLAILSLFMSLLIQASLGKLVLNDETIPEKEDSRRNPLVFRNPVDDSSESETEMKKTTKTMDNEMKIEKKTEKAMDNEKKIEKKTKAMDNEKKTEKTEKAMDNETKTEKKTEKTAEKKQKKTPRKGKKKETTMAVDQSTTDGGDYEPL